MNSTARLLALMAPAGFAAFQGCNFSVDRLSTSTSAAGDGTSMAGAKSSARALDAGGSTFLVGVGGKASLPSAGGDTFLAATGGFGPLGAGGSLSNDDSATSLGSAARSSVAGTAGTSDGLMAAGSAGEAANSNQAGARPCLRGTYTDCHGLCIDTQRDAEHCGGCDKPCAAGKSCVQGNCKLTCTGGSTRCGDRCVDLRNDPDNCGTCNSVCDIGAFCGDGQCTSSDGMTNGTSSCPSRRFDFNSELPTTGKGALLSTVCSVEPDGTLAMFYSVDPSRQDSWANCRFAVDQNLSVFDEDNEGGGVLEVVLCSDGLALGEINLRYGIYPNEKHLTLVPAVHLSDALALESGCRVRYFSSKDACFDALDHDSMDAETRAKALDESCGGKCGATPVECYQDYSKSPLILTVEWGLLPSRGELRLLSVRHYPATCSCIDDRECRGSNEYCRRDDALDCHDSTRAVCGSGVCVAGGIRDCGDMVGRTASGLDSNLSPAFVSAYQRHYPDLGCPHDNGGGPYVHTQSTVQLQDYEQLDTTLRLGDGTSAMIYNPNQNRVYVVYGGFWYAYACTVQPADRTQAVGGGVLLGPPINEKHMQMPEGVIRQDFELGSMTQQGNDGPVQILLNTPIDFDPGLITTSCTKLNVAISSAASNIP